MPGLFSIPDVVDNPDGWGPTTEPEHLKGIPYAPFGKGDKVGRISDFAQTGYKYGGVSSSLLRTCLISTSARAKLIELLPPARVL